MKPAYEPAVLARKPLEGTVAANVAKWGVGGLAIDACRIEASGGDPNARANKSHKDPVTAGYSGGHMPMERAWDATQGRWPANVILDEEAGAALDEQTGDLPVGGERVVRMARSGFMHGTSPGSTGFCRKGSGGASRFFKNIECDSDARGEVGMSTGEHAVEQGDVVEVLRSYPDNTFDAVLCDPPYGLSFMGKKWDYDVPSSALWAEVLRVCKPGAPLIAFSGTRTYHRMVVAIEEAGWEIRDQLAWMYGSGFPKSLDVSKAIDAAAGAVREVVGKREQQGNGGSPRASSHYLDVGGGKTVDGCNTKFAEAYRDKGTFSVTAPATPSARQWQGYGTALKPAYEPAVLARKPLEGTVAANVAKWGVGGLAIDACRIGSESTKRISNAGTNGEGWGMGAASHVNGSDAGRWPANVILDEDAGEALDAQTGDRPSASNISPTTGGKIFGTGKAIPQYENGNPYRGETGGASRFFYCAKASRKERGEGNAHPTVKPIALMQYLARLILPPSPGAILVPFAGSGSEMIGALRAGWPAVVGIEREAEYVEIARHRLGAA